jgi:hypothetical protein
MWLVVVLPRHRKEEGGEWTHKVTGLDRLSEAATEEIRKGEILPLRRRFRPVWVVMSIRQAGAVCRILLRLIAALQLREVSVEGEKIGHAQ